MSKVQLYGLSNIATAKTHMPYIFKYPFVYLYLIRRDLVRYRNKPDKSLHQLRTAMHHHPSNQERAINLSILTMSCPGEFSCVGLN